MRIGLAELHAIVQDAARCQVLGIDNGGEDGDETMDAPDAGASPLQHLQHGEFQRELAHAISELPERERLVLSMYYERRSEEHTSELQSLLRSTHAAFCLNKHKTHDSP